MKDVSLRKREKQRKTKTPDFGDYASKKETKFVNSSRRGRIVFLICLSAMILLTVGIYLLPCPISPVKYSMPDPPEWTGLLSANNHLTKAERVFEGQLNGPESIACDGDYIYTGTSDARIVKIHKGQVTTLTKLVKKDNCGSLHEEQRCGRPLGMRIDSSGLLLVADAYLGLFRVNVDNGDVIQLLSPDNFTSVEKMRFLNDVAEGPDGVIYFTDTSTRWQRGAHPYSILEGDQTGRLLSFDPRTKEIRELSVGIAFANGLTFSASHSQVLVCETTRARICRYYLSGPKMGQTDIFVDNLPGYPDNIRPSGRGTFWVGMAVIRRAGDWQYLDVLSTYPWIRSFLLKLFSPNSLLTFATPYGLAVELDADGKIVRTLHDPTGRQVPSISEAREHAGALYLGSYGLPFMSKVSLSSIN